MKIGLIGLPNSGKTTVFNALTKAEATVTAYTNCEAKPNLAVVDVVDDRVDYLSKMYKPQKTVYANIELMDFAGLNQGSAKEGLFPSTSMALIKTLDSLAFVVRNFPDDVGKVPTPLIDIETVKDELLICDMIIAEHRLERIEQAYKRGKKTNALEIEGRALREIVEHLGDNRWIGELNLDDEQKKMIRGFQFLTQKPFMVILNSDETHFGKNQGILKEIEKQNRV
ncbi:MAG: redox-regulated ATPase YchF, partial [Candidatus Aenigmatarchaeota archaeon]